MKSRYGTPFHENAFNMVSFNVLPDGRDMSVTNFFSLIERPHSGQNQTITIVDCAPNNYVVRPSNQTGCAVVSSLNRGVQGRWANGKWKLGPYLNTKP